MSFTPSPETSSRAQAALLGAFAGDSIALGAHWIYDRAEITNRFGGEIGLAAPATTYHPGKQAGDFTHLGDQMWIQLESMRAKGGRFDAADFITRWRSFWKAPGNQSYPDKATRQTLAALDAGAPLLEAGADSEELAGPARGVVAIVNGLQSGLGLEDLVRISAEQTRLTHRTALAEDTARFLAHLFFALANGLTINNALDQATMAATARIQSLVGKAASAEISRMSTGDAIEALGQSCSLPAALPATVLLLRRHGRSFAEAIQENVKAGGDSAARGIVIGGALGLANGIDDIPAEWRSGLRRQPV